jgi:NAD(P)H-hydrate epimerase
MAAMEGDPMSGSATHEVLTAAAQRAADARAYASGTPQDALMESAGTRAAEWILAHRRPHRAVVLAGPGGNGGDGLVVARHLHGAGVKVRTFVNLPIDADAPRRMAAALQDAGAPSPEPIADGHALCGSLDGTDLVVDALFGSGLSRPLEGPFRTAVKTLNAAAATTVSLDLPSGIASDDGEVYEPAVRAEVTLAMAFLKPSHLLHPAAAHCGRVEVIPVAYPDAALDEPPWAYVLTAAGCRAWLPPRRPAGHKGEFGRVLVIAGSIGMTGAAMLCCRGALRVGAGLVYLAIPAGLDPILEAALPEVITVPLDGDPRRFVDAGDPRLEAALARCDALAIGPGLTQDAEVRDAAAAIIDRFSGGLVIDADALPVVIDRERCRRIRGRAVLTPHPGELSRLVNRPAPELDKDRRDAAAAFAASTGCSIVLKGRPTVLAAPGAIPLLNPTGNDGLATGGTGDVLTGMIAGLLAGGATPDRAAAVAAYLHGSAADRLSRRIAPRSMVASDLLDALPALLGSIERCG